MTTKRKSRFRWRNNSDGTTAIELAILAPVFVMVVFGALNLSTMIYILASMHYAVEDAARCASVKTTICTDIATTESYATSHYYGPGSPSFTATTASCGNSVTASYSYVLDAIMYTHTTPLTASACFP